MYESVLVAQSFSSSIPTVLYWHAVSGKTFGADEQLIKNMEQQGEDGVCLVRKRGDHKVTVLFCPISSRVGADVDAAMSDVERKGKIEMSGCDQFVIWFITFITNIFMYWLNKIFLYWMLSCQSQFSILTC